MRIHIVLSVYVCVYVCMYVRVVFVRVCTYMCVPTQGTDDTVLLIPDLAALGVDLKTFAGTMKFEKGWSFVMEADDDGPGVTEASSNKNSVELSGGVDGVSGITKYAIHSDQVSHSISLARSIGVESEGQRVSRWRYR